jgi:dipeptidase E
MPTCGIDPIWSGLALIDFAIVPHGGDSLLEDPHVPARTVAALTTAGVQFTVLTDYEVILVDR